jgi:hypothetical protein
VRRRVVAITLWACALSSACTPHPVGPARTFAAYEGKAVTTAEAALSAVETVKTGAETAQADKGFGPYLTVLASGQEDELSSVDGTFASIQPPDERSDRLRSELEELLADALDHVASVRIAMRRGQFDGVEPMIGELASDSDALQRFVEEHQR